MSKEKASPSLNIDKKTQNNHCLLKILLKIRYFERGFSFELSHANGEDYEKQKGPGTCDQLPLRLQSKFRISDVLCNQILIEYKAVFELFQKLHLPIHASQFMTS